MKNRKNPANGLLSLTLAGATLAGLSSCSAAKLKPDAVAADEAALFGHIRVVNRDKEVTSSCYAEFTDKDEKRKLYASLDQTGWIFSTVKPGETYLSFVMCNVGGMVAKWINYRGRELKLQVPGNGQLAYFGNVTLSFDESTSVNPAVLLLGGAVAGAMAGAGGSSETAKTTVETHLPEAMQEYRSRYGKTASSLKVTDLAIRVVPSNRMPASSQ